MIARKLELVTVGARSIGVVGSGPRSLKTQPMTSLTRVGQQWPKIWVFATEGLYSPSETHGKGLCEEGEMKTT